MAKTLRQVNNLVDTAYNYEERCEMILNVLKENGDEMRAKDIAFACGKTDYYHKDRGNHYWATQGLLMLIDMGLIERIERKGEPVEISFYEKVCEFEDDEPYTITVNGVEYVRKNTSNKKKSYWKEVTKTITPTISYFKAL